MKFGIAFKGGGQRGESTACVLDGLEQATGKLARETLSYVAGTSTGALLAGAVAAGIPASKMIDFYVNRTKEVFRPTSPFLSDVEMLERGHKYDISNLMKLLQEIFTGPSATWTMNDCPIGIMIAAVAANQHDWYFVKDGPKNNKTTGTVKFLEAMCASAAATTYFDPQRVAIPAIGKSLWFFDGGVGGVANPTYQAAREMFEYDSFDPADTRLLTLGTGYYAVPADEDAAPPKGLLQAIEFATDTLVGTSEDAVDQAAADKWPGSVSKYDWPLPTNIPMDDLTAVPQLLVIGKAAEKAFDWAGWVK